MREIDGFWFPYRRYKSEKVIIQSEWIENAFPYVRNWSLAVDVGAYVGTVTRLLSARFGNVVAFEPLPDAFDCLLRNVRDNVECYNAACGSVSGTAPYVRMNASGYARFLEKHIEESGGETHSARMIRMDDLRLKPDLIKIDAEFTDEDVLKGAEKTIASCHPVIVVEIKGRKGIMDRILEGMGYRPVEASKTNAVYV